MCKIIGRIDSQGSVFIYKNDRSGVIAWNDVKKMYRTDGEIRGEWHTCKNDFLERLKVWNANIDPQNAFLCVYAHMGKNGINCVGGMTPSVVTWSEFADALPQGVQYLWLVGCNSRECMNAWSQLTPPVHHRLLVTSKSKYWRPFLHTFVAEISIKNITFDDRMSAMIAKMQPDLAKYTQYFTATKDGFILN